MRTWAARYSRSRWVAAGIIVMLSMSAQATDVTVPGDYTRIQDAIDALTANPDLGDTVIVEPGTYRVNLQISSDITVRGRETARTFLIASDDNVTVTFSSVSNAVIANFTFLGATTGVTISNSTNITVASNVFKLGTDGTGVNVSDSSTVSVLNNTFYNNNTGLIRFDNNTIVRNNIFTNNGTAISSVVSTASIDHQCYDGNDAASELGTNIETGNPLFVDIAANDFHLRTASPCIDTGQGTDIIDGSDADMGAYGEDFADVFPYPIPQPTATVESAGSPPLYSIELNWSPNLSYLVTDGTPPGGYKIYYDSDESGAPYDGADAEDSGGSATPSPIDVGNVTTYVLHNLSSTPITPAAPVLQEASPSNQRIDLSWSKVDSATDYRVKYGIVDSTENSVDVGNVTGYSLSGLDNGTTYHVTVSAIAQSHYYLAVSVYDNTSVKHESVLSPETTQLIGPQEISPPSNELTAMPEKIAPYPALPNEGCFIATAAYGYYSAPQVRVLRDFRDQYLLTNAPGRAFVRWYYRHSPPAAHYISTHTLWKAVVRIALLPVVASAWVLIKGGTAAVITLLVICLIAIAWLMIWRRRSRHLMDRVR